MDALTTPVADAFSEVRRVLWVGVLSLVLSLSVVGCGDAESRQSEYLSRGIELYESGDYARAGVEFRNVLQIDPKNVESRYYLGLIAEQDENFEGAFTLFRAVAQLDETHVLSRLRIGQYLLLANQVERAKEQHTELLTLAPDDHEVQILGAGIALKEGNLDEAERLARAVLDADPESEGAVSILAGALSGKGEQDQAIDLVNQTLERLPDSDKLHRLSLQMLIAAQRHDEAAAKFRDIIERHPEDFTPRRDLAQFLLQRGETDAAIQVLREAIDDGVGGSDARLILATVRGRTEGVEAGITELREAIAAEPDINTYRFALAEVLFQTDQADEARDTLRAIIDRSGLEEDGLKARTSLARLELTNSNRDAAEALIKDVLAADPENSGARFVQGSVNLADGNIEAAISDLRTVLRGNPDNVEALRLLARAELAQGNDALATQTLTRLVDVAPEDAVALGMLASLQARQGDPELSLETLNQALEAEPDSPNLLAAKATLATGQGWEDRAEAAIAALRELPNQENLANLLLARLRFSQERFDEAFEAFETIRAAAPDSSSAISGSVESLHAAGETERALDHLAAIRVEQPENAFVASLQGDLFMRTGQPEAAKASYSEAKRLQPDVPQPYIGLAHAHRVLGAPDEAMATLEEGLAAIPESPLLLADLGGLLSEQSNYAEALNVFRTLVDLQPNNALAVNNYASLLASLEPDNTAELERAKELLDPFQRTESPYLLDTIGAVLLRLGDARQAQAFLERAIALNNDLVEAHFHLGQAHLMLGDAGGAVPHLETAVNAEKPFLGIEDARAALATAREKLAATQN